MRLRRLFVPLVLALALVGLAAPSLAGPPGKWTVISGGGVINEPGVYRTADGTLHVAMHRESNNLDYIDVGHITESGKLTGRTDSVGAWESAAHDPVLVGSPDGGMRMVFGGIRSLDQADPYIAGYLWQSASPADGLAWTLSPQAAVTANTGYASSGSGATTLPDGTLVAAYPQGDTIYYQVGANAPLSFDVPDCCAYHMTLAQDAGVVYAAWYANGDGEPNMGQFVRTIYPTLGPVMKVPGSSDTFSGNPGALDPSQHVAMTTRNGGGVYIAFCQGYPTCDSVRLWRIGADKALKLPGSKDASHVSISPAPSGRLWIAFDDTSDNLHAVRTNTTAKEFGAVRTIQRPQQGDDSYHIWIEGTRARADLLYNDGDDIWHQQIFAGLTLKASPGKWNGDKSVEVEFKVTDAGDGVQGAKVKAKWDGNKLSCKTEANGKCTITFPKMGKNKIKVTAKKADYAPDETKLKVL
jgi:hypothetical protein